MTAPAWFPIVVVLLATTAGAVTDIWKFRVYNMLTIPLLLSGLVYAGAAEGWTGLAESLAGAAFGFGILFVPYLLGLMGAGDVKLLAGVGAWLGLTSTIVVFAASSLIAGVYAAVLIAYRGRFRESWTTLALIGCRFAVLGRHFGRDDLVEVYAAGPERRFRVIPFGAMVPPGVIGALLCYYWLGA